MTLGSIPFMSELDQANVETLSLRKETILSFVSSGRWAPTRTVLGWFGDCFNVGSRLLVFYLGDEEISSSCLVASKSDDLSVFTWEFNTLVIGGRDSFHRMDPWRA